MRPLVGRLSIHLPRQAQIQLWHCKPDYASLVLPCLLLDRILVILFCKLRLLYLRDLAIFRHQERQSVAAGLRAQGLQLDELVLGTWLHLLLHKCELLVVPFIHLARDALALSGSRRLIAREIPCALRLRHIKHKYILSHFLGALVAQLLLFLDQNLVIEEACEGGLLCPIFLQLTVLSQ